jgi:hypothetical protein
MLSWILKEYDGVYYYPLANWRRWLCYNHYYLNYLLMYALKAKFLVPK